MSNHHDRIAIAVGALYVLAALSYWPLLAVSGGGPVPVGGPAALVRPLYVALPGAILGALGYWLWSRRGARPASASGLVWSALAVGFGLRILAELFVRTLAFFARMNPPREHHDIGVWYWVGMLLEYLYQASYTVVILVLLVWPLVALSRRRRQTGRSR